MGEKSHSHLMAYVSMLNDAPVLYVTISIIKENEYISLVHTEQLYICNVQMESSQGRGIVMHPNLLTDFERPHLFCIYKKLHM